jgi:hypothetical protein
MLVDENERHRRRRPKYIAQTFYGHLQRLLVVRLPPSEHLQLAEPTSVILAVIRNCKIICTNDLRMEYYKQLGRVHVVDVKCLQCVVGRVSEEASWALIDRSGTLARAIYIPDEESDDGWEEI